MEWPDSLVGQVAAPGPRRRCARGEIVQLFGETTDYLLARSRPRRRKERAIRRRQRRGLAQGLRQLCELIDKGKLKKRDKILERLGRLKGRFPKARLFVKTDVTTTKRPKLEWSWDRAKYKHALAANGAYLYTKQAIRLDGSRILGNLHSTDRGRASLSSAQERVAIAADLAPLQRADPSPCDGVRLGVRPLEDA